MDEIKILHDSLNGGNLVVTSFVAFYATAMLIIKSYEFFYNRRERRTADLILSKMDSIDKHIESISMGSKNVLPVQAVRSSFKPSVKLAIRYIGYELRKLETEKALLNDIATLKTRHDSLWTGSFHELIEHTRDIYVDDRLLMDFVQSFKSFWTKNKEISFRSLIQHMQGQPTEIAQLESWLSDLRRDLIHACEVWADTGVRFQEQEGKEIERIPEIH